MTEAIRGPRIDRVVSTVARHPAVREVMRDRQRELADEGDAVIEGRDIGTVVAPQRRGEGLPRRRPRRPRAARRQSERPEIGADALATDLRLRDESDAARMQPADDAVRDRHHRPRGRRRRRGDRGARPLAVAGMNGTDAVWAVGRATIGTAVRIFAPLRVYGRERVPREGGVVLALNHFHWLDPPAFGTACPRTIYYMAKVEAHRIPGLGQLIRAFGTFSVRRGRVRPRGRPDDAPGS